MDIAELAVKFGSTFLVPELNITDNPRLKKVL